MGSPSYRRHRMNPVWLCLLRYQAVFPDNEEKDL